MPRVVDVVDESVLRVSKLSSFLRIAPRRSSDIAATSVTTRGSRSALCAVASRVAPHTIEDTSTVTSCLRVVVIVGERECRREYERRQATFVPPKVARTDATTL